MTSPPRTYGQYCPAALALDLVGDRWSLLIVRELGVRSARYGELRTALPGIATNLLAQRLADLVAHRVIETGGTATRPRYRLTEWGRELFDIVVQIGRWGARLLLAGQGDRDFQGHYLVPVALGLFDGGAPGPDAPAVTLRLDVDDEPVRVELGPAGVRAAVDLERHPADVVVAGPPEHALAVLAGFEPPPGVEPDVAARLARWTDRARRPAR